MSPKIAILILIIFAFIGSIVFGFMYYAQKNRINYNSGVKNINRTDKKDIIYKEGSDEYYNNQINQINSKLSKEISEGNLTEKSMQQADLEVKKMLDMRYNSMTEEERMQEDKKVKELIMELNKTNR